MPVSLPPDVDPVPVEGSDCEPETAPVGAAVGEPAFGVSPAPLTVEVTAGVEADVVGVVAAAVLVVPGV